MVDLTGKKILMVLAPKDFRDEEFLKPKQVFENSGAEVKVASKGVSETNGTLGAKVKVDLDLAEVKVEDYEAIVFVGGPGSSVYFYDQGVLNLAKEVVAQDKVIAAICIAPSILADAGLLEDKKATAFSSEESNLKSKGATYVNEGVVVDGKIVTAQGPQVAKEFGEKIVEVLTI